MAGDKFYYFAYGSHMASEKLKARYPSAKALGVAKLPHWKLVWNKEGGDGSAKVNIQRGRDADCVFGVIYEIAAEELSVLQRMGYSDEYLERALQLRLQEDIKAPEGSVSTYIARPDKCRDGLSPYAWYKEYVTLAAEEYGLPISYQQELAEQETSADADAKRIRREEVVLKRIRKQLAESRLIPITKAQYELKMWGE